MACACILVYCDFSDSGLEALDLVGHAHPRYKGAASAGQARYVRYLYDLLHIGKLPNVGPLAMSSLNFGPVEGVTADRILVQVVKGKQILFSSDWESVVLNVSEDTATGGKWIHDVCVGMIGDAVLRVYVDKTNLFKFGFHTGFVVPGEIRITSDQLDDLHKPLLQKDWVMRLSFDPVSSCPELEGDVREYLDGDATRILARVASLVASSPFRRRHESAMLEAEQCAPVPVPAPAPVTPGKQRAAVHPGELPPPPPFHGGGESSPSRAELRVDPLAALGEASFAGLVLARLDPASVASCARVCRAWRAAADREDVWARVAAAHLPGAVAAAPWKAGAFAAWARARAAWAGTGPLPTGAGADVALQPALSGKVMALAARGRWLAAVGEDPVIRVWDVTAAPEAACIEFPGHMGDVTCVAITSDLLVVTGSSDTTVRVCGTLPAAGGGAVPAAIKCLFTLRSHIAEVTAVVECGEGLVASAGADYVLNVWSLSTGAQLWTLQEPVSLMSAPFGGLTAVTPWCLGAIVYDDDDAPDYREYDVRTGKMTRAVKIAGGPADDLEAANLTDVQRKVVLCGSMLCVATDSGVSVIHRTDKDARFQRTGEVQASRMEAFACEPASGRLLLSDRSPALLLSSQATRIVGPAEPPTRFPTEVTPTQLLPTPRRIYYAGQDNRVHVVDLMRE
jgi:hypothetical protein